MVYLTASGGAPQAGEVFERAELLPERCGSCRHRARRSRPPHREGRRPYHVGSEARGLRQARCDRPPAAPCGPLLIGGGCSFNLPQGPWARGRSRAAGGGSKSRIGARSTSAEAESAAGVEIVLPTRRRGGVVVTRWMRPTRCTRGRTSKGGGGGYRGASASISGPENRGTLCRPRRSSRNGVLERPHGRFRVSGVRRGDETVAAGPR